MFTKPMKPLRRPGMQRVIATLFLLASFMVQVQVLYACTHMEMPAQRDCCCEHGSTNPCPVEMETAVPCCDTQISVTQEFTDGDTAVALRAAEIVEKPVCLPSSTVCPDYAPVLQTAFASVHPPDNLWAHRSDTYLLTLRFRE